MGGRELDFNITINKNSLQSYLETHNNSYRQARQIFNALENNTANPLVDYGVSGNTLSFVIILLEKIIRNTNIILNQNDIFEERFSKLENGISEIKQQGLEPIIEAGNRITNNLKTFEKGFQDWDQKFTDYSKTFLVWNTGFKTFEENFIKLDEKFENYSNAFNTWDSGFKGFEDNFSKLETFLNNFSDYWNKNISRIQTNLDKLENHISQFNDEVIQINTNITKLEKDFYHLQNKPPAAIATTSGPTQKYQVLPSKDHTFKF